MTVSGDYYTIPTVCMEGQPLGFGYFVFGSRAMKTKKS